MWQIIGWIIWGIVAIWALSFAFGCRSHTKSGQDFQWATGVQTFFLWLITILFLVFDLNKLHILWIAPAAFFTAQLLVFVGIPILSPLVLFVTRIFLNIVLIGIRKSDLP